MGIIEQLQWRYATKKFDETLLLSKEKKATLKEAFNLTATSYGLQPVKLVILSNKELQCQLVPHTMNQPKENTLPKHLEDFSTYVEYTHEVRIIIELEGLTR